MSPMSPGFEAVAAAQRLAVNATVVGSIHSRGNKFTRENEVSIFNKQCLENWAHSEKRTDPSPHRAGCRVKLKKIKIRTPTHIIRLCI